MVKSKSARKSSQKKSAKGKLRLSGKKVTKGKKCEALVYPATNRKSQRPSPALPANHPLCQRKKIVKEDGSIWKSTADKNGIFRWKKQ